jgi:NAD(P)-dependent dehydrogenase (short-subunit alcohol dehydrogenase family)
MLQNHVGPDVMNLDKVTIITGGSKGIGSGCAKVFAKNGATVVICDVDSTNGSRLASQLTADGPGTCHFEKCDVRRPADLKQVLSTTIEKYGRLDCLINNAGVSAPFKPIDDVSIEEFHELLQVNLISCFVGCKLALPHLRKTKGSIINMGSLTSLLGLHWAAIYSATKGAISSFTKALAIEEARAGVRVNAVLPGNIITQSRVDLEAKMKNGNAFHDYVESWQWLGRSGTIEEVGEACLFLASDSGRFITGIDLILSGGAELGFGVKEKMPEL